MNLNGRLEKLETRLSANDDVRLIFLPDNHRGDTDRVRREWEHFKQTGRLLDGTCRGSIIIPDGESTDDLPETVLARMRRPENRI